MPFDSSFSDIYRFGIKGAAEDIGAYAERVDEQIFVEGMLDRIFNQISKADVVVADMSGRNPNVFYEVGYAHALGKIVVLLTQDSNDIPFDLKHRQHTVYGGKIEVLRRELAPKLQWAIRESQRRGRRDSLERFSIRLAGVELKQGIETEGVPEVVGEITNPLFRLPLQLRNDAVETLVGITHVYFFSDPRSPAVPAQDPEASWGVLSFLSGTKESEAKAEPRVLDSFTANPVDAPDGLVRQCRLPTKFASLPPGAIEQQALQFWLRPPETKCDQACRLRLHTGEGYYDHGFRLRISLQDAARSA
jgi:hypothetical protein